MKKIFVIFLLMAFLNINILPSYAKTVKVKANTPVEFTVSEVIIIFPPCPQKAFR